MAGRPSALETWSQFTQSPEIVNFFSGLFHKIGVIISDTGEELTAVHTGDAIHFSPGLDSNEVDYVVSIQRFQVDRLAKEIPVGNLSELEQHRVIRTLFTPATRAILAKPIFQKPWVIKLSGAETPIFVVLDPFSGEDGVVHTLEWTNQGWKVTEGRVGQAKRTFHLNTQESIAFLKRASALSRKPSLLNILRFAQWYRSWRNAQSAV